jgi:ribonuclease H / adenosylcobalamin/alpha-ribazole phosphatase
MERFVVEADGGSRGNPGPAGYGAVVKDASTGETLAEAAEYIGTATNNVAEYRGLIAGLRAARRLDPAAAVRVRMDSKLVVEQMSGRWQVKHPAMRPLAAEAAEILPRDRVTYEWIPRERNKHADRLANEAMDAGARGEQWEAGRSTAELDAAASGGSAAGDGTGSGGGAGSGDAGSEGGVGSGDVAGCGDASGSGDAAGRAGSGAVARAVPASGWGGSAGIAAPTTFVLLRHGETPLTPEKRFSGSGGTDPGLSDKGLWQVRRAAEALAARGTIEAVVSSPLLRCRQTAGAAAELLGLDVHIEDGLRETDFGAWEGLTFAEVKERHQADLDTWLASVEVRPTGGGESFATVTRRVCAARDRLTERHHGRTVLVVTHVTPIKTLVRLALGAPPESVFRMELSAASTSVVAYYADGNASLRLFNDTSYLRS